MTPFRNIVVGLDFSEMCTDILDVALDLSRHYQGRIHLVHVVPDALDMPWMPEASGMECPELEQRYLETARLRLAAFAMSYDLGHALFSTAVLAGEPSARIVDYAAAHGGNVIVVGSHGHTPVRRLLLGSVAERILRQATCPVVVVPHRLMRQAAVDARRRGDAVAI
jgi:nucleotide-binding universal stress UspA family protein